MLIPHQSSFRDPSGYICENNGRILRVISKSAAAEYEAARNSGVYAELVSNNKLVGLYEINQFKTTYMGSETSYILEHPRLPFISLSL